MDEAPVILGRMRGVNVILVEGVWLWLDDNTPAEKDNNYRACARCGKVPQDCPGGCPERHDPCLGHIDGIASACCGHGCDVGYVRFPESPNVGKDEGWLGSVRIKSSGINSTK